MLMLWQDNTQGIPLDVGLCNGKEGKVGGQKVLDIMGQP
jgi:hypothetical protein